MILCCDRGSDVYKLPMPVSFGSGAMYEDMTYENKCKIWCFKKYISTQSKMVVCGVIVIGKKVAVLDMGGTINGILEPSEREPVNSQVSKAFSQPGHERDE